MTKILLIMLFAIFANADMMDRYDIDTYFDEDHYKTFEKEGITEFLYYDCSKASVGEWIETKVKNGTSYNFKKNNIISPQTKVAQELLKLMDDYFYAANYLKEEKQNRSESYDEALKKVTKKEQKLSQFFEAYKDMKNVDILIEPVVVSLKQGKWQCHERVSSDIVNNYKYYDKNISQAFYLKHKSYLQAILTKRSFYLLALLSNDLTLDKKDLLELAKEAFINTNKFQKRELLDALLYLQKYEVIEHYKTALTQNYKGNPFVFAFQERTHKKTNANVQKIKELGFNFYMYEKDIAHNNLLLSMKYRTEFSFDLIDSLKTLDDLNIYIYYAIVFNDLDSFEYLFTKYPEVKYTKTEVSSIILEASKQRNLKMVKFVITRFPYEEYENIVDEKTGLNALGYAKEGRYPDKELVAYLEEHNFESQTWKDGSRSASNFFNDVDEVFNGIGYLIGISINGYSN